MGGNIFAVNFKTNSQVFLVAAKQILDDLNAWNLVRNLAILARARRLSQAPMLSARMYQLFSPARNTHMGI